jgi:hypothetical protein
MFREDYYKFSHSLFPHIVFSYRNLIIDKILKDKEKVISSLKNAWKSIEVVADQIKNEPPDFQIEIRQIGVIGSLIILALPDAINPHEALYIGILFDDGNLRYFTYEIGEAIDNNKIYFLGEWTADRKHVNHGTYEASDIDMFFSAVSIKLVYDLF